jgi:ERCC4-type nuclease
MNATVEDLMQVEGIGRISAEKIREVLDIKS